MIMKYLPKMSIRGDYYHSKRQQRQITASASMTAYAVLAGIGYDKHVEYEKQ